jgi:thiamine pyrophosphokinase
MKQSIVIVANGNLNTWIIKQIHKGDFIIGVDRAAYWLIAHGIIPDVAIVDFDSVSKKELDIIQKNVKIVKKFFAEKDFTDTELALSYAIKQNPSSIIIFGGSGTRIDHTFGTIHLLTRCQRLGILAVFRDQTNEVRVVGRGRTILEKRVGSRYVSVLPITQSILITLRHFKYEITRKTIRRGQTIGISNEFTGRKDCVRSQAQITIHRGTALIVQSRD